MSEPRDKSPASSPPAERQRHPAAQRVVGWGKTDVGRKRDHNEDSFLVDRENRLFVVADGMGGHAAGELASRLAVELVGKEIAGEFKHDGPPLKGISRLVRAFEMACAVIFRVSQEHPDLEGMGTTLTGVWVEDDRLHLAHVGDSRCYLFRHGEIFQLSQDHSLVNEQMQAGLITAEEAKTSQFRHVITRSVGFEPVVEVDAATVPLLEGDMVLLCSDGLVNFVDSPAELSAVLARTPFPQIPSKLIEMANERGGDDNITVVLLYIG